jgi:cation transport protein ChaC
MSETQSHWVFGYGSLIWRPGFDHIEARQALLRGAHRRLCIYSHRHRGTPEQPGLVFGLLNGGSCHGMAFRVAAGNWAAVRAYLREREQVTGVYREVMRPVSLIGSRQVVHALSFVVDQSHTQFAGRLDVEAQFDLVRDSSGQAGPNRDYVLNTADHLAEMGIEDRHLKELAARLRASGW